MKKPEIIKAIANHMNTRYGLSRGKTLKSYLFRFETAELTEVLDRLDDGEIIEFTDKWRPS